MKSELGPYISALLYTNETVNVPGLGSFVSSYAPAGIDPVQGELSPPSKQLVFNQNLLMDDGLLVQYISEQEGISLSLASERVASYAQAIKTAIANREMVHFTGLGRLYKNYEGQYQFVPDGENYSTDAYGLPNVKYYPVGRASRSTEQVPVAAASAEHTGFWGRWLNSGLVTALVVAAVVVGVAIYALSTLNRSEALIEEEAQRVPTARVNVRPSEAEPIVPPSAEQVPGSRPAEPKESELEEVDTESPTVAPDQRSFVIIIGSFGNAENVERLVQQIYEAGYEPYTERSGGLTKVGIQKAYDRPAEIKETLREVRKEFSKGAVVYRR